MRRKTGGGFQGLQGRGNFAASLGEAVEKDRNESQSADFMSSFGSVEAVRILTEGQAGFTRLDVGMGCGSTG
jgi:hypothetical protein